MRAPQPSRPLLSPRPSPAKTGEGVTLGVDIERSGIFSWTAMSMRTRSGRSFWRRFARNRGAVGGVTILVVLGVVAVIGPFLVRDPAAQNIPDRLSRRTRPTGSGPTTWGETSSRAWSAARRSRWPRVWRRSRSGWPGDADWAHRWVSGRPDGAGADGAVDLLLALPAILLAITIAARLGAGCPRRWSPPGWSGCPPMPGCRGPRPWP